MKEKRINFISKGRVYQTDFNGVVHQMDAKPYEYNEDYLTTYDKPEYREASLRLSWIRLALILEGVGKMPDTILDFGYGRGDFMREAKLLVPNVIGYDVTDANVPDGCEQTKNIYTPCDVITFWDSLEHCPNLDFVKKLNCEYVAISLPCCHKYDDAWFDNWKHRKPDEHLHHFNYSSLTKFFNEMGYDMVILRDNEDIVRKPVDHRSNILSGVFRKRNAIKFVETRQGAK